MKNAFIIFTILLINSYAAFSQELRLIVTDQPLNIILGNLSVEVSFNDKALSNYKVSVKTTFRSPEEALSFLLKDKPFTFRKIKGVYVISSKKELEGDKPQEILAEAKKYYSFSGVVSDCNTGEKLPYSYISTSKGIVSCDEAGYFNLKKTSNEPIRIQAQYLGYDVLDTLLSIGSHEIKLTPKTFHMREVVVNSSPATMLIQSGKTSGEIRVNHLASNHIPGSIDNSVFNLLRMMPGVRASGEPSDDLIVWGSNIGESQVTYDGYTIFGLKNYNDHIGSVNPYLVKDIRLLKGGFNSSYGNRIGSIAEITGNDGDFYSPSMKATISNYTATFFASTPLNKRMNISVAYRQTFYNLYNEKNIDLSNGKGSQKLSNVYIKPEYDFKDLNLKLSGKAAEKDNYYISLYGADDRFKFSVNKQSLYEVDAAEKNRQYGGATAYKRIWDNGSSSKLLASYSKLSSKIDNLTAVGGNAATPLDVNHIDNSVQELSFKLSHELRLGEKNQLQFGTEWQQNEVLLNSKQSEQNKISLFANDNLMLGKLSFDVGVRADFLENRKAYIQPRLSARYTISEELTATASWGLYNQYLTRNPFEYRAGYQMVWSVADSTFMDAMHAVGGLAYSKNGFLISAEGYVKTTKNGQYFLDNTVYTLDNTIVGADVYAKKEIGKNTLYASYSIVNLKQPKDEVSHELKLGGIGAFDPFYFSLSYVYGTGFSYISTGGHGHGAGNEQGQHGASHEHSDSKEEPYSRFDVGVTYKMQFNKVKLQAGASILNIFDTKNIKYNYQLTDQKSVTNIFTKATPFTPTVFIEIIF